VHIRPEVRYLVSLDTIILYFGM